MKHTLILMAVLAMLAVAGLNAEPVTVIKTYQDSNGFYVVSFKYEDSVFMRPATYPEGCPHYYAIITVFVIKEGKQIQISKSWEGYFTDGKCYEDNLLDLVNRAKETT